MKRARTKQRKTAAAAPVPAGTATESVIVPVLAPRNPFVSLAHARKAGVHGGSGRSRRQAEKRELKKQLDSE